MSLIDKIRRSREQMVPVGGFTFLVRRPTDIEMLALAGGGGVSRLLPFVVGWDGVKEIDIIPGGDPHPLPFDAEVCAEWLADRPDLLTPLVEAIMQSYRAHAEALAEAAKN
jgi:hypothetical protein